MSQVSLTRPGRRAAIIALVVPIVLLGLIVAAGWYYSSLLKSGALEPDYSPDDLDLRIVAIESNRITLMPHGGDEDNLEDGALWGLEGENGYGQVHAVLGVAGDEV